MLYCDHGFSVAEHLNLSKKRFTWILADFSQMAAGAGEAIIFYAGHGMAALNGAKPENILAPSGHLRLSRRVFSVLC